MLEDHIVPQLRKFRFGMGIASEQGGECAHKLMTEYRARFGELLSYYMSKLFLRLQLLCYNTNNSSKNDCIN